MRIKSILVAAFAGAAVFTGAAAAQEAPAKSLTELLSRIQSDTRDQSEESARREAEFRRERDQQARLLAQAKAELEALEQESVRLQALQDENDLQIAELEAALLAKQGDFGELFGTARQAAGDVRSLVENSVISPQLGLAERTQRLARVAETSKLPSREDLDSIWKTLITEMVHQREVARFTARVANYSRDGGAAEAEVIRVGSFIAFANDRGNPRFLSYESGDTDRPPQLKVLARPPASAVVAAAKNVIGARPGSLVRGPVDPSRGTLLGLVVDTPNLRERVDQGGIVGYVTIGIAVIGIVFGILRLFQLFTVNAAVRGQARSSKIGRGNPLGRIMLAAQEAQNSDVETFELKLDDAIIRESSGLDFGLNFLKLAAGVAPLLGLLGTVTGMILTFQQITLFGTGDPKIMADGISQALVTTVLGLVSAIPLLLIHSFCASASRGVQQVIEEQAAGIVAEHASRQSGGR